MDFLCELDIISCIRFTTRLLVSFYRTLASVYRRCLKDQVPEDR